MKKCENQTNIDGGKLSSLPLASVFLGPHAENGGNWEKAFSTIFADYMYWRKNYYSKDGFMLSASDIEKGSAFYNEFSIELESMLNDLKQSFPFHSPRYMGHMLSEQSLPAVMGYFATMLYNPNNVTEEAAPVTVAKELDFGKRLCKMLGYSANGWAHLCSGGSSANLEALWTARQSQFFPLVLRDICRKNNWDFKIKLPNFQYTQQLTPICRCSDRELLHLIPNESIYMLANLSEYLRKSRNMSLQEVMDAIKSGAGKSEYNIRTQGYGRVLAKTGLKPVIFVPQSAHYSLKKTVNILGYGEAAIRPIPTTEKFRIDIDQLDKLLRNVANDEYIVAVVAVFGTTEEGAVDPVHRVKWLRDAMAKELSMSFWIHVDAAWGGYFAVMKNADPSDTHTMINSNEQNFFDMVDAYIKKVNVSEEYTIQFGSYEKKKYSSWNDREVCAAMFALSAADSITVDPHKMGYVPYPAGVIAFKNKRIVYLLQQHASYIGTDNEDIQASAASGGLEQHFFMKGDDFSIPQVGAYTLEGSRPGAAAMACWFASEIIPLDLKNHGKIIRTTVLNARRFAQYLQQHKKASFQYIDEKLQRETDLAPCKTPFTIELLYNNIDTNLVCFFVRPTKWDADYQEKIARNHFPTMTTDEQWTLEEINQLNKRIHERLTISPSREADSRKASLYQKFYVADTKVDTAMYCVDSMKNTLARFGYSPYEYQKYGLYVMRSTIMNPWYYHAAHSGKHTDYFMEFLEELHYAARKAIDEMLPSHAARLRRNHIG